jgi:hypothetical protein
MGLTTQDMPAPERMLFTQWLQERHRRGGSPERTLLGHSGSAIKVRPSAIMSALPLSTAFLATAGLPIRPTPTTGTSTSSLTRAAKSTKVPSR